MYNAAVPIADAAALARLERFPIGAALRVDRPDPLVGHHVVLPAAFNPPTYAHLRLLQRAAAAAGAGGMVALLTTKNVDKELVGAPLPHRVGMLLTLASRLHGLAVVVANVARIADQAAVLRRAYPSATFDFVVGYDTLVRLFQPRYYEPGTMEQILDAFFAEHRVLATNRGMPGDDQVRELLASLPERYATRILPFRLDELVAAVSSTEARFRAARREPPAGVPPEVRRYILRHRLYRSAGSVR